MWIPLKLSHQGLSFPPSCPFLLPLFSPLSAVGIYSWKLVKPTTLQPDYKGIYRQGNDGKLSYELWGNSSPHRDVILKLWEDQSSKLGPFGTSSQAQVNFLNVFQFDWIGLAYYWTEPLPTSSSKTIRCQTGNKTLRDSDASRSNKTKIFPSKLIKVIWARVIWALVIWARRFSNNLVRISSKYWTRRMDCSSLLDSSGLFWILLSL